MNRVARRAKALSWMLFGVRSDWPRRAAEEALALLEGGGHDVILTTAGPFELLPVGFELHRATGVPWVVDLRDPASTNVEATGVIARRLVRLRRLPLRRQLRQATALVAATEQVRLLDGPWLGRDLELVVTGFDPAVWNAVARSTGPADGRLRLVFAGKIYERYRRPDTFLAGLRLFDEGLPPQQRGRVRLVYLGREGQLLLRLAARHRVAHLVDDGGFVPPAEVPRWLAGADALLLLTNESGHSGVPGGKLFEYLGARRPILAVPGGDQVVAELLDRTGAGVTASHPGAVASRLEVWYEEWRRVGSLAGPANSAVEPFSSVQSARRMAEVLARSRRLDG